MVFLLFLCPPRPPWFNMSKFAARTTYEVTRLDLDLIFSLRPIRSNYIVARAALLVVFRAGARSPEQASPRCRCRRGRLPSLTTTRNALCCGCHFGNESRANERLTDRPTDGQTSRIELWTRTALTLYLLRSAVTDGRTDADAPTAASVSARTYHISRPSLPPPPLFMDMGG